MSRLILASGSVYRRQMLERLGLVFEVDPADIDETPRPGEDGASLARRLSREKAAAVADRRPGAIVIGADQVAECNGRLLGKPGNAERAAEQLAWMSGRTVVYYSAMAICRDQRRDEVLVPTILRMRALSPERIERYLQRDRP
ncbi:MAG: Maf family protein, partial [Wenzhouxiangella sp.]|nr:Maf family protein [Wenzhouxiangella sp.]